LGDLVKDREVLFATVTHAHLNREQLREALEGTRYDGQVLIPEDGERIEIISSPSTGTSVRQ
jgi:hypothetical protein